MKKIILCFMIIGILSSFGACNNNEPDAFDLMEPYLPKNTCSVQGCTEGGEIVYNHKTGKYYCRMHEMMLYLQ